jgi:hypothetical protein
MGSNKKPYYPGGGNPMHAVNDWAKMRDMIRALRRGERLPVVYMDGQVGHGVWLSGTHRVAASEIKAAEDSTRPYVDLDIFDINIWAEEIFQKYDNLLTAEIGPTLRR